MKTKMFYFNTVLVKSWIFSFHEIVPLFRSPFSSFYWQIFFYLYFHYYHRFPGFEIQISKISEAENVNISVSGWLTFNFLLVFRHNNKNMKAVMTGTSISFKWNFRKVETDKNCCETENYFAYFQVFWKQFPTTFQVMSHLKLSHLGCGVRNLGADFAGVNFARQLIMPVNWAHRFFWLHPWKSTCHKLICLLTNFILQIHFE